MLLVVTALALLATVPLAGGKLGRLADIRPRAVWAVLLAAVIQVAITQMPPAEATALHAALHVLSYVLDAYFLFANRRLVGVPLVALGAALNVAGDHHQRRRDAGQRHRAADRGHRQPPRVRQLGGAGPSPPRPSWAT